MFVACGGETSVDGPPPSVSRNSAPVFTSESNIASQENIAVVATITAGDAENSDLIYDIVDGADSDRFLIDSRTGELRFREAPDFETPRDSNANNTYIVVVSATDGENTTNQTFAVSVVDHSLTVEVLPEYIKALKLNWSAVKGVMRYQLLFSPDGVTGFRPVGDALTANKTEVTIPVGLTNLIADAYLVLEGYDDWRLIYRSDPKEVRSTMIDSVGFIKASNAEGKTLDDFYGGDFFGYSMALSADGQTLAVGAPREDSAAIGVDGEQEDNSAYEAGAVYVFTRAGAIWRQQAYIKASNSSGAQKDLFLSGDTFGSSVALSADGNTLAVGAPGEASNATGIDGEQGNNLADGAGAVYIFKRIEQTWIQQTYVKASNTDSYDKFGGSVALSADGKILAVGASKEGSIATGINGDQDDQQNNAADSAGAVYVYTGVGPVWTQQAYVKASNTDRYDNFGSSVALSADGQILAVGAPGEGSAVTEIGSNQHDNTMDGAGAAYVYLRAGQEWTQQAFIKASTTNKYDHFGESVALSADGQTLAVGAPDEDSAVTGINGNQHDNTANGSGAVYVYLCAGSVWSQQFYIKASNAPVARSFGDSMALSADGQTLVVGAPFENGAALSINGDQKDNTAAGAGAVYVFTRNEATWAQQAYVKASNTDKGWDAFGYSIALSADVQTLAIGAPYEDSGAAGLNGDQQDNSADSAGAVYLY